MTSLVPNARKTVVLLVQSDYGDRETYAGFLHCEGLAPIGVSHATHASWIAPSADVISPVFFSLARSTASH
jgi:hypothetical protein